MIRELENTKVQDVKILKYGVWQTMEGAVVLRGDDFSAIHNEAAELLKLSKKALKYDIAFIQELDT